MTMSKTKRAILDAALALSDQSGISGTTMDDVAVRAGVAKGSLYYNFSSKDQLFEALLDDGLATLAGSLREAKGALQGTVAILALVDRTLDRITDNRAMAKLLVAELFRTDRAWKESLVPVRSEIIGVYAEALAEIDGGEAPAAAITASALFGAVLVAGLEWVVFEPERPRAVTRDAVLALFSGRYAFGG